MTTSTKIIMVLCIILMTFASMSFAASFEYDSLNRLSQVTYDNGTKIVYNYDASGNRSQQIISPLADLDTSGFVDLADFVTLASQWLDIPGVPSADIAPWPDIDNLVDMKDLATLAEYWLEGAQD